ncbi:hypothetical protein CDAR_453821 [Caerostris darwini]|uniref:Uncharacterized protein n=1 Tax=Caerostris darwini TaxID=1538125 RepID=A0AAV4UCY8_9ARAC|nr:hypothetical protein CDAR_453821 [Caerostris darwini]
MEEIPSHTRSNMHALYWFPVFFHPGHKKILEFCLATSFTSRTFQTLFFPLEEEVIKRIQCNVTGRRLSTKFVCGILSPKSQCQMVKIAMCELTVHVPACQGTMVVINTFIFMHLQ